PPRSLRAAARRADGGGDGGSGAHRSLSAPKSPLLLTPGALEPPDIAVSDRGVYACLIWFWGCSHAFRDDWAAALLHHPTADSGLRHEARSCSNSLTSNA